MNGPLPFPPPLVVCRAGSERSTDGADMPAAQLRISMAADVVASFAVAV